MIEPAMTAEELVLGAARAVPGADAEAAAEAQRRLDQKTKPVGSLGRLEELAVRLAGSQASAQPRTEAKVVVVAAADHGVVAEGVSAYPQAVTRQMVANFASGGAAVTVLARGVGARVVVVDLGVKAGLELAPEARADGGVIRMRIGDGTANLAVGPAMSVDDAARGVQAGIAIAYALAEEGLDLVALGEMGIGNSTAAAALIAALTGRSPDEVTGRGTGVDDAGLARKRDVVTRALAVNRGAIETQRPLAILAAVGGFEIAGLAGLAIGAASIRVPVIIDGLISTAAALVAVRLAPALADHLIAAHLSPEPGHQIALDALKLSPLLSLGMRLGEGTGATLAFSLCDAAARIVREMATFESAGVSRKAGA